MALADNTIRYLTLPSWEKKFFRSICSIPWKKFIENQKYMHLSDKVMNWDDSAVKEAFDNARIRFRAKLNNLPCNLPLPDPDIYIDKVDWDSSVDPKLFQDMERDEVSNEEERGNEVVILGISLLLNQTYSGAGWGDDDDEEAIKPAEVAQGWESNSWEDQHYAPVERAKEIDEWQNGQNGDQKLNRTEEYYEWQNGQNYYRGWDERERYGGGEFHNNKGRGRNGWNGNWGSALDGNNRRREYMTWSRNNNGGYSGNEYQMNGGRRNNSGGRGRGRGRGRRGNFGYVPAGAW